MCRLPPSIEEVRMWLTTRSDFREGDEDWANYLDFIQLPNLNEVRSLDSWLNKYVDDCGSCPLHSLADVQETLAALPRPSSDRQYYLLAVNAEKAELPPEGAEFRLLGYDLSDVTHTSSVLNCGPWKGRLGPLAERLNRYGLLTRDDALLAKTLLPSEWPGEPHAAVTIWALYEVASDLATSSLAHE
jgi:hypothetical protein